MSDIEGLLDFVHRAHKAQTAINTIIAENGHTDASLNKAEAIVDDLEVLATAQAVRLFERAHGHTPSLSELTAWADESGRTTMAGFLRSERLSDRITELLAPEQPIPRTPDKERPHGGATTT